MANATVAYIGRHHVALLALFLALGGTSFAAASYVSGSQIKPHSIPKNRLTNKAIKSLKGNLGPQGRQGPTGPQGQQGAQGANGATDVVVRFVQSVTSSGSFGNATARCNRGERATGGGVEVTGTLNGVWYSAPGGRPVPNNAGDTPTGWYSDWFNGSGSTDSFRVYVVCASP
jgi:hypothetical protein